MDFNLYRERRWPIYLGYPRRNWALVNSDIEKYYDIFPKTVGQYKVLAESVYTKLVEKKKLCFGG